MSVPGDWDYFPLTHLYSPCVYNMAAEPHAPQRPDCGERASWCVQSTTCVVACGGPEGLTNG